MHREEQEADYLAKAKDAQDKSDLAKDYSVQEAWKRIAADYRAMAAMTKVGRFH